MFVISILSCIQILNNAYKEERVPGREKDKDVFSEVQMDSYTCRRKLGEADLICLKNKKCILLQIKSTSKKSFYYYGYNNSILEGFPFFLIVDFGYNKIRVLPPKGKILISDGKSLDEFLKTY